MYILIYIFLVKPQGKQYNKEKKESNSLVIWGMGPGRDPHGD